MHELGIINYVVKRLSSLAQENGIEKISAVTLEFGEVSGIVPHYLYRYWEWYKKKFPLVADAELRCEEIPAITWCDACRQTYPTVAYGKTCPYCGSGHTWLQQGNEMNIKEIEIEEIEAIDTPPASP